MSIFQEASLLTFGYNFTFLFYNRLLFSSWNCKWLLVHSRFVWGT